MNQLTIAIASDLHIGTGARGKDLCPDDRAGSKAIDTEYISQFLKFISQKKLSADYLLVPGDISESGFQSELHLAEEVIDKIAAALTVPSKNILFVPGNHDVNREIAHATSSELTRERYSAFETGSLFKNILNNGNEDLLDDPFFSMWDLDDILVVGYNSSSHDGPGSGVPHYGLVLEQSLLKLANYLDTITKDKLRIFLVHHHPLAYTNPIPHEPDFSIMTNAQSLLRLLRKYHFDLLIHGHKHKPNIETHIIESGFPLVVLAAGSLSALLDTRWSHIVSNQFHLLKIDGRNPESGFIFGFLESWRFICGQGWVPCEVNDVISHREPFGTYIMSTELEKNLLPILTTRLSDRDYVEWNDIFLDMPYAKYLPHEVTMDVLNTLGGTLGFRCAGSLPNDLILLKEVE